MASGIHSLSNGTPDAPWPRRERVEMALADWLKNGADDPATLFGLLRPESDDLAEPVFINASVYGTRCSTVVALDHAGKGWISERRFDEDGQVLGEVALAFRWA